MFLLPLSPSTLGQAPGVTALPAQVNAPATNELLYDELQWAGGGKRKE